MVIGIGGIKGDGGAMGGGGFVDPPQSLQRRAQIGLSGGIVRFQGCRPAEGSDGTLGVSLLLQGDTERVVRLGIVGGNCQNAAVCRLGLAERSTAMQGDGAGEALFVGHDGGRATISVRPRTSPVTGRRLAGMYRP